MDFSNIAVHGCTGCEIPMCKNFWQEFKQEISKNTKRKVSVVFSYCTGTVQYQM